MTTTLGTNADAAIATAAGLRARSAWLDPATAVDLLRVAGAEGWLWEREGAGFAGVGAAMRIALLDGMAPAAETVAAVLGAIVHVGGIGVAGSGPVAVGALPFDPKAPAELVVPQMTIGRTANGRYWTTTVAVDAAGPGGAPVAAAGAPPGGADGGANGDADAVLAGVDRGDETAPPDPDGFELESPLAHQAWMQLVTAAVGAIAEGRFSKVVLAREVAVTANRVIHVPTVLRRLRALYPACTVLSAPAAGGGRFIAASPELLVSRHGGSVRSQPLAGTIARSGDPADDRARAEALLGSVKDRAEHAWVVADVEAALRPWCDSLTVPDAPSIVALRNVSHLGSVVEGRLGPTQANALTLATALHPTAAVGGSPRADALAWLDANEGLDRGPYAGPAGWMDANGDGEWVVGIRSAVVSGCRARLFAGVGVVEGSDPASELAETQFKLQALLAAVVRP